MSDHSSDTRERDRVSLLSNLPGMAYRCANDDRRTVLMASRGCRELTGYEPSELIDNATLCFVDLVHAGDRQWVRHNVLRAIATHERFDLTYRIMTATGDVRWVQEHGVGVYDSDGDCTAFEGFVCDITDFKQTQQREGHLNSVLRSIRNVNQIMLREKGDAGRLIQGICDTLFETWGYEAVFIHLFDPDGGPGRAAKAGYAPNMQEMIDGVRHGRLPSCAALTLEEPELYLVHAKEEQVDGTDEQADSAEQIAAILAGLVRGERTYGVLCITMSREMALDPEEHVLLQELINDIVFTLHGFEQDRRRSEAEEQVRFLARFPSENPNPVLRVSHEFRVMHANEAATALLERRGWDEATIPRAWRRPVTEALSHDRRCTLEVSCGSSVFAFTVAPVTPEAYVNLYGLDITESRLARQRERRLADDMMFLSHTAMWFVEAGADDEIHEYIARKTREIAGEAALVMVTVNDWDDTVHRPRAILGLERVQDRARELFGREPMDLAIEPTRGVRDKLASARLERLEGGLNALLCPALEASAVDSLTELLGVHEVFIISFQRDSEIHGSLIVATREDSSLRIDLVEAFMRQASVALARRRAEQALQEAEHQLRQSQKMEAIGILAGGIAHDFNNMLGAIIGYTDLVRAKVERDSPTHRKLSNVLTAARRAADLVRQILTFSRGSQSERQPLDIASIVKEALKLLRPSLPTTIEIVSTVTPNLGTVKADPTQIHQVLMNLCTNAAHAMRGSCGTLEVSLERTTLSRKEATGYHGLHAGDYLVLSVADNGTGMDEEVRLRIFDPFYTTKPQGEGTGMGLAVVHGIVHGHGGDIRVETEPGAGSTFKVYLPVFTREHDTAGAHMRHDVPRGTERVLFVDDEQLLVDLGEELLREQGYAVEAYSSSLEALEAFKKAPRRFDVVVTDLTMPKMAGLELARQCRASHHDIPIVLCTGNGEGVSHSEAREAGICEYAFKPLSRDALASVVRRALDTRDRRSGGAVENKQSRIANAPDGDWRGRTPEHEARSHEVTPAAKPLIGGTPDGTI